MKKRSGPGRTVPRAAALFWESSANFGYDDKVRVSNEKEGFE